VYNYAWIVNRWIVIIGSCIVNYTNPNKVGVKKGIMS